MTELQNGAPWRSALARYRVYSRLLFRSVVSGFIVFPGFLTMMAFLMMGSLSLAGNQLRYAESLVRDVPDGMVRTCLDITDKTPMSAMGYCDSAIVSRTDWLAEHNRFWFRLWLIAGLVGTLWHLLNGLPSLREKTRDPVLTCGCPEETTDKPGSGFYLRLLLHALVTGLMVYPGIIIMMLFLMMNPANLAGNQLDYAESLVRNVPDGMVRTCLSATDNSGGRKVLPPPPSVMNVCHSALVPETDWVVEQNRSWFFLWLIVGVVGAICRFLTGLSSRRDRTCL